MNNNDGTFTYTSETGVETIYDETTTTIDLNTDGNSIDYVDEDGQTTTLNLCNIVDNCETVTSLSFDTNTNELVYIDENGDTNTITIDGLVSVVADVNDGKVIATHTSGDGTVENIEETVTTLVNNNDGTFTYTSETGVETIYDETTTTIDLNTDGNSIDYVDEDGQTTTLNLCNIVDNCENGNFIIVRHEYK